MSLHTDGIVDPLGLSTIGRLIDEGHIASADYRAETASTNTAAMSDLREGRVEPEHLSRLYLTDNQTAGRGRHGRTWVSPNLSLTFSLLVHREPQLDALMLPIAVGVAIARAIEFSFAPLKTRLKWPNDVYLDGGKVAGILVETTQSSPSQFVLGVGVNVNQAPELSRADEAAIPKAIATVIGRPVDRFDLLETIVQQIQLAITDDRQEVIDDFRQRCWLTGFDVGFETNQPTASHTGKCRGIDEKGQLLIEVDGQIKSHTTGEVRRMRLLG